MFSLLRHFVKIFLIIDEHKIDEDFSNFVFTIISGIAQAISDIAYALKAYENMLFLL